MIFCFDVLYGYMVLYIIIHGFSCGETVCGSGSAVRSITNCSIWRLSTSLSLKDSQKLVIIFIIIIIIVVVVFVTKLDIDILQLVFHQVWLSCLCSKLVQVSLVIAFCCRSSLSSLLVPYLHFCA